MDETTLLAEQYADASNLGTRGEFNARYTVRERHPHEWVLEQFDLPEDARILDLGCGPAPFWAVNAGRVPGGWQPVLADFSRGMVGGAREALDAETPAADLLVADAAELPFAADSFDAVLANQMLYHVPDVDAVVRECHRVLAADGTLYATTGSEANADPLYALMDAVADGDVENVAGRFTAENGADVLGETFASVERRTFDNEVVVDDPDAVVAYALSLPLADPALAAFDPGDAEALRAAVAERVDREGELRWRKDLALFVAEP